MNIEGSRKPQPVFFHVDMDAFFASVEQLDFPELKGLPVIVGALPGHRGVVAACSYEARKFGVHSAMPSSQAAKLCPRAIFRPGRMGRYCEVSSRVMAVFSDFTPEVHQVSIDEAFLNMTGMEKIFGTPMEAGKKLKDRIRGELELTISVGIAGNRYMAKLASKYRKPDGLFQIETGKEIDFLDSMKLGSLWGIGDKTLQRLESAGLRTILQVRECSIEWLEKIFGKAGCGFLKAVTSGRDPGIINQDPKSRSISNEITFESDSEDPEFLKLVILELSHQVFFRLLDSELRSQVAVIKFRYADFTTFSSQINLGGPLVSGEELAAEVWKLFQKRWTGGPIRLIGVGAADVEPSDNPLQQEFFGTGYEKNRKVEEAVLGIKKKFGKGLPISKASLMDRKGRQ